MGDESESLTCDWWGCVWMIELEAIEIRGASVAYIYYEQ